MSDLLKEALLDRSHLPLRQVARVVIERGGRILITHVRRSGQTEIACYNFPGGGVEPGDTPEFTAAQESLQEVGVKIKNVRPLGVNLEAEHEMGPKRNHLFRGTDNHYYVAEFDGYNKELFNSEGDGMSFSWETPESAIRLIQTKHDAFNQIRIDVIHAYMKHRRA